MPPVIVAKDVPEMTVKTVRASVLITLTTLFAKVSDAEREQEVGTPTPGAAAAEVGDARRNAVQEMAVETGGGSVTLMLALPTGALTVQALAAGERLTASAAVEEKESAPTGTVKL